MRRSSGVSGKWDVAAREFVHGAVTKAAGPQVPAAIGAERRLHHRRPDAGAVVAVLIDRRHQHRCSPLLPRSPAAPSECHFRLRSEIQQRQRIRARAGQPPRGSPGIAAAIPLRSPGCRRHGGGFGFRAAQYPSVAQRSIASIMARNSIEVATVLRKFWRTPRSSRWRRRVGKMLRAGPQIDPHLGRLRQIVAARIGVGERPAPLPVFGRSLGVNNQRVGLRAASK